MAILGKIVPIPKGTYSNTVQYKQLDFVSYNGSSYIAKKDTLGNLPTVAEYWNLMAEKGQKGDKGEQGIQGNKGDVGNTNTETAVAFEDYTSTAPPSTTVALEAIKSGTSIKNLFSNIKAFCKGVVTVGQYPQEFSKLLVNNGAANVSGKFALDAAYGKTLSDGIASLNDNLEEFNCNAYYGDLNELDKPGIYNFNAGSLNSPTSITQWGFLLNLVPEGNANYQTQVVFDMTSGNAPISIRMKHNNLWREWRDINNDLDLINSVLINKSRISLVGSEISQRTDVLANSGAGTYIIDTEPDGSYTQMILKNGNLTLMHFSGDNNIIGSKLVGSVFS